MRLPNLIFEICCLGEAMGTTVTSLHQDGLLDEQAHELLCLGWLEDAAASGEVREREVGLLQEVRLSR